MDKTINHDAADENAKPSTGRTEARPVEDKGKDYAKPLLTSVTIPDVDALPVRNIHVINEKSGDHEVEITGARAAIIFTLEEGQEGTLDARIASVANSPEELATLVRFILDVVPNEWLEAHPDIKKEVESFDKAIVERVK